MITIIIDMLVDLHLHLQRFRRRQDTRAPEETFPRPEVMRSRVRGVGHVCAKDGPCGGGVAHDEHVSGAGTPGC